MDVSGFCNSEVVMAGIEISIIEAAAIMRENHVGDIVIARHENGKYFPSGILTDRDIALSIVVKGVDPETTTVGNVMSFDLTTVKQHDDLMHVIELMHDKGIRRMPIVDADGAVSGIITVDDILSLMSDMLISMARLVDGQQRREDRMRP